MKNIFKTLGVQSVMLGITMMAALTGCSTNLLETKSKPQIDRIYEATSSTTEDALATVQIYNAAVLSVAEVCADPATPLAPCEVAEKAVNGTEGAVTLTADLLAEALSWKEVYQTWQGEKDGEAYDRVLTAFQAATAQALTSWTQTKPRIEASLAVIGRVERPVALPAE